MTYDQYLNLKNDYHAMIEELKKYNEHTTSQQGPTAQKQHPQRPNVEPKQSDSQKA